MMATATGSKEGKRGSKEGKHREITKIIISRRMGRFRKQLRVFWKALSVLDVMRTALGRGSRFGIPMKIKENQRGRIVTPYLCTPRARVSRAHVVFARGGVFARAAVVFARAAVVVLLLVFVAKWSCCVACCCCGVCG